MPQSAIDQYGDGFIGLLRPELYERLLDALPEGILEVNRHVEQLEQDQDGARLFMADGEVVETDVWGDQPAREQNLHILVAYIRPARRGGSGPAPAHS